MDVDGIVFLNEPDKRSPDNAEVVVGGEKNKLTTKTVHVKQKLLEGILLILNVLQRCCGDHQ